MYKALLFLSLSAFYISCNTTAQVKKEAAILYTETPHFKLFFSDLDTIKRQSIIDILENNYSRIIEDLGAKEMPIVEVHFYANVQDLKNAVKDVEPNLPDFAIGLATSVSQIHILSPNTPSLDFNYMMQNTVHEFAHCVTIKLNANIPNNPRWLWETVAIYEGNSRPSPLNFQYLLDKNPPSLDELSRFDNTFIYEVGYYIGEYLVATKGKSIFKELILNNGNVETSLGMNNVAFTKAWYKYLRENDESFKNK